MDRVLSNQEEMCASLAVHGVVAEPECMPSLSVLGLDYAGAVSTACFAKLGHRVIGVDHDVDKVQGFNAMQPATAEEGLQALLEDGVKNELLSATQDVVRAVITTDITLVSIDTAKDWNRDFGLRQLCTTAEEIGHSLRSKEEYHCVLFSSALPLQITSEVLPPILEAYSGKHCGMDFGVCFSPEFLRQSTAVEDFFNPAQTVIDAWDARSADTVKRLLEKLPESLSVVDFRH